MDTEGLSIICAGLGFAEEDENGIVTGYSKSEYCLDNLKDLQRFLRRDDPQRRDVFKQICKWNTVSRDLIPIIEHYQSDWHLVIGAVKILVFLTMPIDPASDDIAQQIEYLWDLKAAMTRNVTVAVIVSLLEDPLEHLECNAFTEDDWKLVQLVLTLFRNLLAIQEITLQQKTSGSATQFMCLTDRFLELMFQENVMDLILVLTQHVDSSAYLQQDNLLLLEIFHYIVLGRDPELIAGASRQGSKVTGDITTSVDSLRSIMEEEGIKRRNMRLRNFERHSQFSGTFTCLTMDGSKTLFKGNPSSASGNGLLNVRKVQRGPLKRTAWDHGSLSLPKESTLELLHNFLNQFLSGGYNVLMQSLREDINKEHQSIQNTDVITFFQLARFVLAFQYRKASSSKKPGIEGPTSEALPDHENVENLSFHGNLCGPIAATINEAMFLLVISKWREAFEGLKETNNHKSLSAAGSLMKSMICMLDLVLKLLPEDAKEPRTARILLYKLFYDQTEQGLTQFLLNLFKSFDTHKQPKSDLADLLEIIHVVLRLMEKLQAHGTLRVSKKSRKVRKKKTQKENDEVEAEKLREHANTWNADEQTNEIGRPTSQPFTNSNNLVTKEPSAISVFVDKGGANQEGNSVPNPVAEPDMPLQDTGHLEDDLSILDRDKENNPIALAYETADSSNDDQLPATTEVDFNISRLVTSFANNAVLHNLCWLLKYYKSNSASTNHYIICMLRRFCDDLEISPMLYQLSLLTTFYAILADEKSTSKAYANIVNFLTKLVRKMLKIMKKQPLLFVEILFWKARKECHCINAEALMSDIANLKKDIRVWDNDEVGLPNGGSIQKSIADSLGDDEADLIPHDIHDQREEILSDGSREDDLCQTKQTMGKRNNKRSTLNNEPEKDRSCRRKRVRAFNKEQELEIKVLFERFKNHRRCSHMIAKALDGDNTYTAAQVSRKLKQLGLLAPQEKRSTNVEKLSCNKEIIDRGEQSDEETLLAIKLRSQRTKSKLLVKETPMTSISQHKETSTGQDSDFKTLSTIFKDMVSQHELGPSHKGEHEAVVFAAMDDRFQAELDNLGNREQDGVNELEDLVDSGDDLLAVPKKIGFKRSLKLVVDDEDD
ncbi:protein timeless homolog [Phoenix dactylifera]|uniref:Protein timeless homolog n=1 Tax=Phoenix dactylifera TaxID=42345 RepID=A0A8B7CM28_PHODC|nr:protein timeless homolog [Phoenix dactylifera]